MSSPFILLARGLSVSAALLEVLEADAFHRSLRITTPGSPHGEAEDVWLRMDVAPREAVATKVGRSFPLCRAWLYSILESQGASRLGRAFLSRLPPGGRIEPHVDVGPLPIHYDVEPYYTRFHLVLQGGAGNLFHCGGESVEMKSGDLWSFDNTQEHWVLNAMTQDRIHLLFDLRLDRPLF